MGDLNVHVAKSNKQAQKFVRHLLNDVKAVEYMLANDWFEDNIIRIGAEQELCIVDQNGKPTHRNIELLEAINHEDVVSELAQFNIELNLTPNEFKGDCFSKLENEILEKMNLVEQSATKLDIQTVMAGILPTIRKSDVAMSNVTPLERYRLIINILNRLRGSKVELKIGGTDELIVHHDSALMEACNTSFQVHLQIKPKEFVDQYNFSQIVAAPLMAIAANSPLLFGRRLWHETRVPLFQQSIDTRRHSEHLREQSPRVSFGNKWLTDSIADLYKEDVARYQVILNADIEQDSMDMIEHGKVPDLRALNIHNGTIYRWNRPCYGISKNGKPHLRIENRIIPSGPTVIDEVANAAFWIGLMHGNESDMKEVIQRFDFDDAKTNFFAACRYGIDSYFNWIDGEKIDATDLLNSKLIPLAKKGLKKAKINKKDIDRYMGVIEDRVSSRRTGASWMLDSFNHLIKSSGREEAATAITAKMIKQQKKNIPVHQWELAELNDVENWSPYSLKVEEFMTTDLYSAQPNDIIEFLSNILEWNKIRHLPIENKQGKLVGVVSSRLILRHYKESQKNPDYKAETAKDIMVKEPITISPYASIKEAIQLMESHKIGCLPVVKKGKLVGMVTESDFLELSSRLMKRMAD